MSRVHLSLCLLLALACSGGELESGDGPATLGAEWRDLEEGGGVALAEVEAEGPAERAGLRDGDLLEALDGQPVATVCELEQALAERRPGDEVRLAVQRDGKSMERTVRLANVVVL